jgi:hypothetical protein
MNVLDQRQHARSASAVRLSQAQESLAAAERAHYTTNAALHNHFASLAKLREGRAA